MLAAVLRSYNIDENKARLALFGSGLINHTWKVQTTEGDFILQQLNHQVFRNPQAIADNLGLLSRYFAEHHPGYLFVRPIPTNKGEELETHDGIFFRLMPFVPDSHTVDVVNFASEAFEAAKAFGRFTHLLSGFDAKTLQTTLPDFHNLLLRYRQFETACKHGNKERRKQADHSLRFLREQNGIVATYKKLLRNNAFKLRVTHHDTKISNVLFDENAKALCVIDLDTVMPGYFISDVGDMLRTFLSPISEEESDLDKIQIRDDYFNAIAEGYLSEMRDELSGDEIAHFVYAGKFMTYMQALRFLTDYLNNDVYYGQKYEGHNLVRATNQITLLQRFAEKENSLQSMVNEKRRKSLV